MKKECVTMLLAGGEGKRLGPLTKRVAKPAVHFGGKYRIIDFSLSNCSNSGMHTIGILTQYQPVALHNHIGTGGNWGLERKNGGLTMLQSNIEQHMKNSYSGTANAIYQNINYIDQFDPDFVLVISGDHVYKMDYSVMLNYHKGKGADLTIGVKAVPLQEASRFGTVITNEDNIVLEFEEKPKQPKSNKVSMGIYIFNWRTLKKYLLMDEQNTLSSHDFGKDVIPLILKEKNIIAAYSFDGYWKDVGTVESLWESNMDLLTDDPTLDIFDPSWEIYSSKKNLPPHYISSLAVIKKSIINDGCCIQGQVINSVLFNEVSVGKNSLVQDSVIMPNVKIGDNCIIKGAIIGNETIVLEGSRIGKNTSKLQEVTVIDEKDLIINERLYKKPKLYAYGNKVIYGY